MALSFFKNRSKHFYIISFCIRTIPDLPGKIQNILDVQETIVVIIFTVEYLLRILVADNKLKVW